MLSRYPRDKPQKVKKVLRTYKLRKCEMNDDVNEINR